MRLFDQFERSDLKFAQYSESDFTYMNRTAREDFERIRQKLEEWFSHYPKFEKKDLQAAFRSNIDAQHRSALFELLLHEVLIKLNCEIVLHPALPNTSKHPDFLVKPPEGSPFYLEAVLATTESADEVSSQARINAVYDVINRKVDSTNFFLWVDVEGSPESPPSANRIASFLNKELAQLDPEQIADSYESGGMDTLPSWRFEYDGWVVNFQPIPKKPAARSRKGTRPIGAQSTGICSVDHRTPIREAINKKAGRYGELDLPYIIAVNVLEAVDNTDIIEALFGKEQYTITFTQSHPIEISDTQISRVPDGAWTSNKGLKNTRVSAVLVAKQLSPWRLSKGNVRLYHNPMAQKPYFSVLNRLPQAVVENNRMKYVDGESIGSILGISSSWPEDAT